MQDASLKQRRDPPYSEGTKTIGVRLKEDELAALHQRFRMDGFRTLTDLVKGYVNGEISRPSKSDHIETLLFRLKEKNFTDPLGGELTPTFYRNVDIEDLRLYLQRKYRHGRYGNDLVRYYQRFAEFFFTKPDIVKAESGKNRSWICDAMRRFGEYYDYKFQNPMMKLLIREIIERYEINRHMRKHDQVWIADHGYLENTIMNILKRFNKGELAVLIRFALFTGLRGEEISYVHNRAICPKLAACNCENLHVVNKSNGISVILVNRTMGQKHCYFTIVPTQTWLDFRNLPKADYEIRRFTHQRIKEETKGETAFMDLRKFHYNINVRSEMKEMGAEVLAGRAKTVSARHYLLNELDLLVYQYRKAWQAYLQL